MISVIESFILDSFHRWKDPELRQTPCTDVQVDEDTLEKDFIKAWNRSVYRYEE